jgi:precorrin-6B methylase 2
VPSNINYLLGHSDQEIERLRLQALCLEGLTRRLIKECGIEPGMRVLDIGSGVGDVAVLVAEVVGPSGSVVGIDAAERAVEAYRHRARPVYNTSNSLSAQTGTSISSGNSTP